MAPRSDSGAPRRLKARAVPMISRPVSATTRDGACACSESVSTRVGGGSGGTGMLDMGTSRSGGIEVQLETDGHVAVTGSTASSSRRFPDSNLPVAVKSAPTSARERQMCLDQPESEQRHFDVAAALGTCEQVALGALAAQLVEDGELVCVLDAFGDAREAERRAEVDHPRTIAAPSPSRAIRWTKDLSILTTLTGRSAR